MKYVFIMLHPTVAQSLGYAKRNFVHLVSTDGTISYDLESMLTLHGWSRYNRNYIFFEINHDVSKFDCTEEAIEDLVARLSDRVDLFYDELSDKSTDNPDGRKIRSNTNPDTRWKGCVRDKLLAIAEDPNVPYLGCRDVFESDARDYLERYDLSSNIQEVLSGLIVY